MAKEHTMTRWRMTVLAGACLVALFSAQAQETKEGGKGPGAKAATLVGAWKASERHEAHGSLFQPVHSARKRDALIYFEQDGDQLTGRSETPKHKQIAGQGDWDGRRVLSRVRFSDDKLVFEVDIADWSPDTLPLSPELTGQNHKGTMRVEAQLRGDKLAGRWGIFTKAGAEIFRGEWEAVRMKESDK